MQIEYRFVVDSQCIRIDKFQNNIYPQNKKISIAQTFCGRIAQNCSEMMPGLTSYSLPKMVIMSVIVCEKWQKLCFPHKA